MEDGVASFVAGRSTFLDHGLRYIQLDARTGRKVGEVVEKNQFAGTAGEKRIAASRRWAMPGKHRL